MAPKRQANGSGKTAAKKSEVKESAVPLWDSDSAELHSQELELSSSDDEQDVNQSDDEEANEEEIQDAVLDYMATVAKKKGKSSKKAAKPSESDEEEDDEQSESEDDFAASSDDDEDEASEEASEEEESDDIGRPMPPEVPDPESDSSDDERPQRNTIGEVPLEWYKEDEHIGYDRDGNKIIKKGRRDALERMLARSDSAKEWRTIYDEYNDEEIVLSKEEMKMIMRIREGKFPHSDINPFEPENDWFTRDTEIMPLSAAPEPKRRFIPSKWEEKKVVKLVRAMRKGWLKSRADQKTSDEPDVYLMWDEDGKTLDKTAAGLTYIPAPKLKLPGHDESYNPPKEYLPSQEEKNAIELMDDEEKPSFVPMAFDALRRVPAYTNFIKERFERCLDLYLCPRSRIKRLNIDDPSVLIPKLPKPKDLQPFPTILALKYSGHKGPVKSIAVHPSGQWLLSASADGTVKLWEVKTSRCLYTWTLGEVATCVAWCPNPKLRLAAVAAGKHLFLLPIRVGDEEGQEATETALEASLAAADQQQQELTTWTRMADADGGGIDISHNFILRRVSWHSKGDYFSSVAPAGNTQAVLVHQLSRGASQNPFRKNKGRVVEAQFHPTKPFFFVATQQHVRIYNLAKQALAKKLVTGSGVVSSLSIHASGDHVIVGSEDRRLCWYDLDLSTKPYKALRYHDQPIRGTAYHKSYPLFASGSDDGTAHVFHGMVYNDLMTNPLIVPVKILKGHKVTNHQGVLDVAFHPTQPWLFTAGGDGQVCLFVNP